MLQATDSLEGQRSESQQEQILHPWNDHLYNPVQMIETTQPFTSEIQIRFCNWRE